jgi:hypothetical protein
MENVTQHIKDIAEQFNNQSLIIIALAVIAVDLLHLQLGEASVQLVNTIVSGLLGMAMGRTVK